MKLVKTDDAVGQVLCHDITQIIKGVTKDAVFRKGHVIREEDIPVLKSVGKFNIYVWENDETMMHENDAAKVLYEICRGDNLTGGEVKEGKIELTATCDGLLTVDRERLDKVNSFGQMMIASRHGNFPVKKGDKVAGTRIIPLVIEKEKMDRVRMMTEGAPIFNVKPFVRKKVGIVTTGREVYEGLIEDTFTDVILEKLSEYSVSLEGHILCTDDKDMIVSAIRKLLDRGCDLVICTGGMSVDPDDMTPYAIKAATGDEGIYGAPVLPGAMFMIGYYGNENIPVMGLPGCVMYSKRTIFDLILPRVMADEKISKEDIDCLGEGGLCLNCSICTFPNCGFGK